MQFAPLGRRGGVFILFSVIIGNHVELLSQPTAAATVRWRFSKYHPLLTAVAMKMAVPSPESSAIPIKEIKELAFRVMTHTYTTHICRSNQIPFRMPIDKVTGQFNTDIRGHCTHPMLRNWYLSSLHSCSAVMILQVATSAFRHLQDTILTLGLGE